MKMHWWLDYVADSYRREWRNCWQEIMVGTGVPLESSTQSLLCTTGHSENSWKRPLPIALVRPYGIWRLKPQGSNPTTSSFSPLNLHQAIIQRNPKKQKVRNLLRRRPLVANWQKSKNQVGNPETKPWVTSRHFSIRPRDPKAETVPTSKSTWKTRGFFIATRPLSGTPEFQLEDTVTLFCTLLLLDPILVFFQKVSHAL